MTLPRATDLIFCATTLATADPVRAKFRHTFEICLTGLRQVESMCIRASLVPTGVKDEGEIDAIEITIDHESYVADSIQEIDSLVDVK